MLLAGLARPGAGRPSPVDPTAAEGPNPAVMSIPVVDGRASADFPHRGTERLRLAVIVSATSTATGPFAVRLKARTAHGPARSAVPVAPHMGHHFHSPAPSKPDTDPVAASPPAAREFTLLVREGDPGAAENYLPVRATLRAVGRHVQVYVDRNDADRVSQDAVRELVSTFDDRVHPRSARLWGTARDVDGDGRFTILMTSWLGRLGGGRLAADGYVRGADFDPSVTAPFGNRCDMLYMNADVRPGPHLKTVLAHEYAHAVIAGVRSARASSDAPAELEGWLDEAVAHVTEDFHGFSRSNLDYRLRAFLTAPERHRLVVRDYFREGLFRSPGHRGATYLFLRWCVDRHGDDLLRRLIVSPLGGTVALERATGRPFPELYRDWTVDLARRAVGQQRRGDFCIEEPLIPRVRRLSVDGEEASWTAEGTTSAYFLIEAPTGEAIRIEAGAPPAAGLQVTVFPVEDAASAPIATVRLERSTGGDATLRLNLAERTGQAHRVECISWEPSSNISGRRSVEGGILRGPGLPALTIPPAGRATSPPISLRLSPLEPDRWTFAVQSIDDRGRRSASYVDVEARRIGDRDD